MGEIVVTEFMEDSAVESLRAARSTLYDPELFRDPPGLRAALAGARALIIRNRTRVDAELLAQAPDLRVLGRLGVGLYNIDLPACRARQIDVIPASGANADSVAEYVILAIGQLLRGTFHATAEVAAGGWPRERLIGGREMGGKTLGIIGFGDIGRRVAKLAGAFRMTLLGHDPLIPASHSMWEEMRTEMVPLEELLARADAVTLHVPLAPETRGLIDAARLARMKAGAVLVNASRGGVVEEAALAAALRAGRLGGAALDVFETEPLPPGSPLLGVPNLILTPHIAGATVESNARVSSLIAARVLVSLAMS
ncbi:NAD(P)-dependent oxidoreductase [Paracraurococcus ruber]|uniref:3-phosphoglycerate dehydrogenase n=1 Tax=Paracraurococcus ruber TaxID=77675 RepID=A0ABS1D7G9_9PROT|nr:NAD(P)-dependent oxidoreductase [Paracraurococcus ruber]MBK1661819.1 3-phosphoglycerate dehydrogenase [Paracraurococcus ruber]TDG32038.1 3-phosphoglycerate dehydrogenase [Paracraurococcus ruber]